MQYDSSKGDPIHCSLSDELLISNSELTISKFQNLAFSNSPCAARSIALSSDALFTHNSVCTQISNMEADCQDVKRASSSNASSSDQMQQLFASLPAQISAQKDIIQTQIQ